MQDLLPLYADEVCTPSTSDLVKEHLRECENCKKILSNIKTTIPNEPIAEEDAVLSETVKNGVKKAKRKNRFITCVATIVTICLLVLGVNELLGWGVCFTNIDNIIFASQFMSCIKNGDYEKAAEMQEVAYEWAYNVNKEAMEEAMEEDDWEERKPFYDEIIGVSKKEYVENQKQKFISHMKIYDKHINFQSFYISSIYDKTTIEFAIKEEYLETGDVFPCYVRISAYSNNNIQCGSGGIKIEETERENFEAYDQYDLFNAINDAGIYDNSIWIED